MSKFQPEFKKWMSFNREGETFKPLEVFRPEPNIIVGVYQGSLSKLDILIKYRQVKKDVA